MDAAGVIADEEKLDDVVKSRAGGERVRGSWWWWWWSGWCRASARAWRFRGARPGAACYQNRKPRKLHAGRYQDCKLVDKEDLEMVKKMVSFPARLRVSRQERGSSCRSPSRPAQGSPITAQLSHQAEMKRGRHLNFDSFSKPSLEKIHLGTRAHALFSEPRRPRSSQGTCPSSGITASRFAR
ncbi:hypothetical protein K402DRAFT_436992 [Aulographum hederae CBS 113979]|uniref:Uncharacterized protein n=1 Tax=Aulographum hederae CBS 113979 TaxID=1176131 RepID=A0A6G1GQG0_9PEZI|nr:hypothetical protein K402DRAFT_436992 [Aulographum hederae CBS 113979]